MLKLIVAGGREFSDVSLVYKKLDEHIAGADVLIISGGARGADTLALDYAADRGLPIKIMPAEWEARGKGAGYIRNSAMADEADELIAFWDGESRGTKHMIDTMLAKAKPVVVVPYHG